MKILPKKIIFILFIPLLLLIACPKEKIEITPEGIEITPEGIEITPEGGEHTLSNGIKIIVPEGAVTNKTKIDVTLIDKSNEKLIAFYESRGVSIDSFYICFNAKPDGLMFQKPISIVLPVDIYPGAIPFAYEADLNTYSYSPVLSEFVINPIENTITLSLDHFSSFLLELTEEQKKEGERWCRENPCLCNGLATVIQNSEEKTGCGGNINCQYVSRKIQTEFFSESCEPHKLTKTDERWKYSEQCEPVLKLTADNTTIPTEGQTTITANINICRGLENQAVNFEVADLNLGSINPTNLSTDTDGNAVTTFVAKDKEGIITITANATVSWYLDNFKLNGIWQHNPDPAKTKRVSDSIDIAITDKWSGTADYEYVADDPPQFRWDASYKVEFEFTVAKHEDASLGGRPINGKATATQHVNMFISGDLFGCSLVTHVPPILNNLIIAGFADEYVHLKITSPDFEGFYTFDVICAEYASQDQMGVPGSLPMGILYDERGHFFPTNSVPLKEGIYKVEWRDAPPGIESWVYTVTLKRGE